MSTNALKTIRAAVKDAVAVEMPGKWIAHYNGEDWADEKYTLIRRRVAAEGSGLYVTIPRTQFSDTPFVSLDENHVYVQVIAAAGAIGNRASAAEAAEDLIWHAYVAMRGITAVAGVPLHLPWLLVGFNVEFQDPSCSIISVTMTARCDFGDCAAEEES